MSESLREGLLECMKRDGAAFSVNGDAVLTRTLHGRMSSRDWDALKRTAAGSIRRTAKPRYKKQMNEHADAFIRMNANKDVTVLMPPHMRLAFVKKTVKKLNMATTRFQEDFNVASLDAVYALAEYAADADRRLTEQERLIERQTDIIERLMREQESLRKAVENLRRER